MSIVEKAVEKLRTLQPGTPAAAPPGSEAVPAARAPRQPVPESPSPLWPVDAGRLRRADLMPAEDGAARRLADELRRTKRPLLNNAVKRAGMLAHARRIVVTSAVPGEGKSFTALNLAMSLAREPDFEVLLVDADVPKAHITRALGMQGRPGLMDVLLHKECRPEEVIVRTDMPNLMLVPAGERHPLTSELFGGRRMEHVLQAWESPHRQRLLVFDSSPLLATSESQVLASRMGQVVMVVAAGRTRRQELKTALQAIDDAPYVGIILNKSRLPAAENHYYDYYTSCPDGGEA